MVNLLYKRHNVALVVRHAERRAILTLAWITSKLIAHVRALLHGFFFCRKTRCRVEKVTLSLKVGIIIFPISVREWIVRQSIRGLEAWSWFVLAIFIARDLVPCDDIETLDCLVFVSFLVFGLDVGVELMAKISDGRLWPVYLWIAVHQPKQLLLRLLYLRLQLLTVIQRARQAISRSADGTPLFRMSMKSRWVLILIFYLEPLAKRLLLQYLRAFNTFILSYFGNFIIITYYFSFLKCFHVLLLQLNLLKLKAELSTFAVIPNGAWWWLPENQNHIFFQLFVIFHFFKSVLSCFEFALATFSRRYIF